MPSRVTLHSIGPFALLLLSLLIGSSTATAATSSVVVTATVPSATNLSSAGCASFVAGQTDFGGVLPGSQTVTGTNCAINFGSSNDTSMLRAYQADGAGSAMWRTTTGGVDAGFGGGKVYATFTGLAEANTLLRDSAGRIVAAGVSAGNTKFAIARWSSTGVPDGAFGAGGKVEVGAITRGFGGAALQPDDKVVIVDAKAGTPDTLEIRRLKATDGSPDTTFNGTGSRSITNGDDLDADSVAIQPDGKIVVVCESNGDSWMVRLNPDGSTDTTYGTNGFVYITTPSAAEDIVLQPDGKAVVAGEDGTDLGIARITTAGVVEFTRTIVIGNSAGAPEDAASIAIGPDGAIVAAMTRDTGGGVVIGRWLPTGAADLTLNGTGNVVVTDAFDWTPRGQVLVQPDRRIVFADSTKPAAEDDFAVIRLNLNGTLDTTFGTTGKLSYDMHGAGSQDLVRAAMLGQDGQLYVAGRSSNDMAVLRLSTVTINDWSTGTFDWGNGATAFGACLDSVSGGAAGGAGNLSWTVAGAGNCTTALGANWQPIVPTGATAGAKVAASTVSGTTTSIANVRFGLKTAINTPPGSYVAPIVFEAIAPNV